MLHPAGKMPAIPKAMPAARRPEFAPGLKRYDAGFGSGVLAGFFFESGDLSYSAGFAVVCGTGWFWPV